MLIHLGIGHPVKIIKNLQREIKIILHLISTDNFLYTMAGTLSKIFKHTRRQQSTNEMQHCLLTDNGNKCTHIPDTKITRHKWLSNNGH